MAICAINSASATNYRSDGRTPEIYASSGPVRYSFDTVKAIKEGYLAQPIFYMYEIESNGKDNQLKTKTYQSHIVENQQLHEKVSAIAKKLNNSGKSVLIMVQETKHADKLQELLSWPIANGENKEAFNLIKQMNNVSYLSV